ncbi:hypothetical protein [Paraburkholderia caledonica]|uniref:hypothetical protein n=1 Tax=Paraburkholderia caledonica TaxID=134536 RepID=UPI000B3FC0A9|nr:hypothetical protein [Paraburkholderia caledonica]
MLGKPTFDPLQQPPLVQALLVALHTLVIHNSMEETSEGQTWTLDFVPQIRQIQTALQTAGIDATKPMLAPVRWADDESVHAGDQAQ